MNLSPKEIVKAAKTEGLSCIEWGSDVHAPCNDYERLQEIVALQQEYGIDLTRLADHPGKNYVHQMETLKYC